MENNLSNIAEQNEAEVSSEVASSESDYVELELTLRNLVDENYYCITELFYFGSLDYDTTVVVDKYAKVTSDRFSSVADLNEYLSSVYVADEVNRLLNEYNEGEPFYIDQAGELYIDYEYAGGAGIGRPWSSYSIEISDRNDAACTFVVTVSYEADELTDEQEETYAFTAVNTDGWRLSEVVYLPVSE